MTGRPAFHELLGLCRDLAAELRSLALAVDADPFDRIRLRSSPTLETLRLIGTPRPFRDGPVPACAEQFTQTCVARVAANIELARGDASVLNACAAPSLAGLTVDALGDKAQRERFYRDQTGHRWWTFFAMTEPDFGSDATAMRTRLDPDPGHGWRLTGRKRYVANAGRGKTGVVWARTGSSLLSIRAVIISPEAPGFASSSLDMMGLRGACIGQMSFHGITVPPEAVLGAHLPASRRGLWGAGRAFNVIRLQIAAQALGVAFAVVDCVREQRPGWAGHELMSARLAAAREMLFDSAAEVDRDPDGRRAPSLAKLHATNLAIEVTRWAETALSPGALLEHPLLEKWCRDACAFEFMDGTSNILRLVAAPATSPKEGT